MVKTQKTVSTSQLIVTVGEKINETLKKLDLSIPKKIIKEIIQGFLETIEENTKAHSKIRLDKIGIFQVKDRAARMGRNPRTGKEIKIPASKKISFRAAKSLKEKVTGVKKVIKATKKVAKKKK